MAAPLVPGYSNVLIDASDWVQAAVAFGPKFDLWAGLEIERVIDQSGEIVQRAVRKRAKRHFRTGSLDRNVRVVNVGAGWERISRVHSGGKHAHLVAGRVRAHRIPRMPRHPRHPRGDLTPALPLYMGNSITGFAQMVDHPAGRGDPYFHVGAMNSRLAINAVLKASAKKMVTHLAEIMKGLA